MLANSAEDVALHAAVMAKSSVTHLLRRRRIGLLVHVKLAKSDAERQETCGVLLELQKAFDQSTLVAYIKQQIRAGYQSCLR